jgi:hypothetical protein
MDGSVTPISIPVFEVGGSVEIWKISRRTLWDNFH